MKLNDPSLIKDQCYINGKWVGTKETLDVTDPATGEIIGTVPIMGASETREAIEGAQAAIKEWAARTAKGGNAAAPGWQRREGSSTGTSSRRTSRCRAILVANPQA